MTEGMRSGQPSAISRCAAAAVVAVVLPLCLQRVFAGPLRGSVFAGEPAETVWVLPPLATVTPLAGLAVRRFRAWPMVLGGLAVIGLGDALGMLGAGSAVMTIAAVAYGVGAGLAVPATLALALATEADGRRLLAAWWVAIAVAALAVLPGLDRYGAAAAGSRVAPGPWLTAVAIVSVLLYAVLRERIGSVRHPAGARAEDRAAFPPAERAQLAMLAAPAGALGLITLAVAYRPQHAATAAAAAEAAALFALAAMMVRGTAGEGFAVVCAALGFIVAPASEALGSLWTLTRAGDHSGGLVAVAAVLGAVAGAFAAVLRRPRETTGRSHGTQGRARRHQTRRHQARRHQARRRHAHRYQARRGQAHRKGHASPTTGPGVIGLLLAGAALIGSCLAGPFAAAPVLAAGAALVTGGLAAAVAGRVPKVTTAGAMAGVAICVAGAGAGYLGEGAIQVQQAGTATASAAIPSVTALCWWELAGATVVLGLAMIRYLRQARGKTQGETRNETRGQTGSEIRSQRRGDRGAGEARPAHG